MALYSQDAEVVERIKADQMNYVNQTRAIFQNMINRFQIGNLQPKPDQIQLLRNVIQFPWI